MFKKLLSVTLLGLAVAGTAHADGPVRLIIAFPPGGPVDLVGRVLAEQLGKELKQQVIVENKAGANGNIAAAYVAKAPGDGSVLF
ncbi:MAG: tripartite tricarboxylate transporter substrate-binding protein, partial [Achromobacter pestifer]